MSKKESTFVPPTFINLGKAATDLFKKKFDIIGQACQIKHVSKTKSGVSLTTTGKFDSSKMEGEVEGTFKDKNFGDFTGVANTRTGRFTGSLVPPTFYKGCKLTVSGGTDPTYKHALGKGTVYGKLDAEFSAESLAFTAGALVGELPGQGETGLGAALDASVVMGADGLSVGASMGCEVEPRHYQRTQANIGFEYAGDDFVGSVKTSENGDVLRFSSWFKANSYTQYAIELLYDPENFCKEGPRLLNFGMAHNLDPDTEIRIKSNTNGRVDTFIEHRLKNPKLTVSFGASYSINQQFSTKADKVGFGVSFGDI